MALARLDAAILRSLGLLQRRRLGGHSGVPSSKDLTAVSSWTEYCLGLVPRY